MLAERLTTEGLSRGYQGTAKTVKRMHKLVAKGKLDPSLHEIATLIRLSVPEDQRGSTRATAEAVFKWVKRHGVFQRDPFQIERIDHPVSSMKSIIEARRTGAYTGPGLFVGDCDTFSIWVATLGGLLGFNYAFETAKVDPVRPDEFSHVWTALRVGGDWLALDASTPRAYPGWRPPVSSPDQFQRWPEQAIEDVMGMGEDFLPMDDYGYGIPKNRDWTKASADDVDPGRMDVLVPPDTGQPMAEMEPGVDFFVKEPIPLASDRPSLTEGDETFDTGPRYSPGPPANGRYKILNGPYPVGSRWNRIQVDESHRSRVPHGSEFHVSPSTVPSRDVDVVDGKSVPVSELIEGTMGNIVSDAARAAVARRRAQYDEERKVSRILRRTRGYALMRPRRTPAGMGQDPYGAEPGGEQYAAEQAAVQKTATEATSSVWSDISKVLSFAIEGGTKIGTTVLENKYKEALIKANEKLTGGAVTPTQTVRAIQAAGPWYTQSWVLVGGGLAALGLGYVVISSMGGKKRRRR